MNKTIYLLLVALLAALVSCNMQEKNTDSTPEPETASIEKSIMVVAHRGDWRNAPENSLQAIENCIEMGVDMVEIDVRMTKDSVLVLMHDKTIDRTTTGKGLISDWDYDSLQKLYLKSGANHATAHKIPTLEEAMNTAKGKILVNLDKVENFIAEAYKIVKKTGTTEQAYFKGKKPYAELRKLYGDILDSIIYMPIVYYKNDDAFAYVAEMEKELNPIAYEMNYDEYTTKVQALADTIRNGGNDLWTNSLWPHQCAGRHDDRAVNQPDSAWGVIIERGATIIQTDRPQLLIEYLESKELK